MMIRADSFSPDVWESICTPMHLILPGDPSGSGRGALYLGSWTAAVDNDLLTRHRVHAIVECHDAPWGACESSSTSPSTPTLTRSPTSTSPSFSPSRPPLSRSATSSAISSHSSHSSSGSNSVNGVASSASGGQQVNLGRFKVAIADSAAPDVLAPHLDGAVRFIRDRLLKGENVLVHCQQGISRSPAIVTAFLMREHSLPYDAALSIVKSRRKCVKPNAGFERTLRSWK